MVSINVDTKPKFTRPEILLHPSIPRALGGINPRTIKGPEWWDEVRKKVYIRNNYCCWACGTFRLDCVPPILDAHEMYEYDCDKLEARMVEVVALCRDCHQFIHWRRNWYRTRFRKVVARGLNLLHDVGLPLPRGQLRYARRRGLNVGDWLFEKSLTITESLSVVALCEPGWKLILDD